MKKVLLGVLAGAVLWAVLWVTGTVAIGTLFPERIVPGHPVTDPGLLLLYIGYSVVLSVLAGWVAVRVSAGQVRTAWALAGLQLALGIGIEAASWSMTPVWYHLVFLALLVPATVYGGTLALRPANTTRLAG